jgi:perosamine synthetase
LYVNDCLDENWISSNGKYLNLFENSLAKFLENENTIVASNGTTALHLALLALDLKPGDEVLIPALTYVATANAIRYCGGIPISVDCDLDTWNSKLENFEEKLSPRTVGVLAVHIYGSPCEVIDLKKLCDKNGLWLVEDCAEAIGATIGGIKVGNFGEAGTFSFYGNKIITTGEGGALIFKDSSLAEKAKLFRGQGMDPLRRYWHEVVGYNYRMTNIQAAIGLGQIEDIQCHLQSRSRIQMKYKEFLSSLVNEGVIRFQKHLPDAEPVNWLTSITVDAKVFKRDILIDALMAEGIESRPFFYPINTLPMYKEEGNPNAKLISGIGINLPTYTTLSDEDIFFICSRITSILTQGQI